MNPYGTSPPRRWAALKPESQVLTSCCSEAIWRWFGRLCSCLQWHKCGTGNDKNFFYFILFTLCADVVISFLFDLDCHSHWSSDYGRVISSEMLNDVGHMPRLALLDQYSVLTVRTGVKLFGRIGVMVEKESSSVKLFVPANHIAW